jgi:predicted transcriptional regulator
VPTTTVRITQETSRTLRELATATGRSMQDVLADAVETYSRRVLLDRTNAAFAALRADTREWQAELEERRAWEATLGDDLEE